MLETFALGLRRLLLRLREKIVAVAPVRKSITGGEELAVVPRPVADGGDAGEEVAYLLGPAVVFLPREVAGEEVVYLLGQEMVLVLLLFQPILTPLTILASTSVALSAVGAFAAMLMRPP